MGFNGFGAIVIYDVFDTITNGHFAPCRSTITE